MAYRITVFFAMIVNGALFLVASLFGLIAPSLMLDFMYDGCVGVILAMSEKVTSFTELVKVFPSFKANLEKLVHHRYWNDTVESVLYEKRNLLIIQLSEINAPVEKVRCISSFAHTHMVHVSQFTLDAISDAEDMLFSGDIAGLNVRDEYGSWAYQVGNVRQLVGKEYVLDDYILEMLEEAMYAWIKAATPST